MDKRVEEKLKRKAAKEKADQERYEKDHWPMVKIGHKWKKMSGKFQGKKFIRE